MTTATSQSKADQQLVARCRAILFERMKNGLGSIDSLHMGKLVGEDSPTAYRALYAVPGVIIEDLIPGKPGLAKFSVARD